MILNGSKVGVNGYIEKLKCMIRRCIFFCVYKMNVDLQK